MTIRLRGKILLGGISIVIFSLFISTLILSKIIADQNRGVALRYLEQGSMIIRDNIKNSQTEVLKNTVQVASRALIADNVKFFREIKSDTAVTEWTIETNNTDLAVAMYQIGVMEGLSRAMIYDMDGDLVAFFVVHDDKFYAGYSVGLSRGRSYKVVSVKKGEQFPVNAWKLVDRLPGIDDALKNEIPTRPLVTFRADDVGIYMMSYAPVTASPYQNDIHVWNTEKTQVGFVTFAMAIEHSVIKRLSGLTGTSINLFARDKFVGGMRNDYKLMDRELADRLQNRPDIHNGLGSLIVKEGELKGDDFMEGVLPFYSDGKWIGAISALYSKKRFHENTSYMVKVLFLVSLVCVLLVVPLTLFFSSSITKPIIKSVHVFKEVARGNVGKKIDVNSADELGWLSKSLNDMVSQLVKMIEKIKKSSLELKTTASEIGSSTAEQSATSSRQAASIEEISATAQEMAASSNQMAENVALVVEASRNTLATALDADKVMENSATGMEEIKESARLTSKKILSLGEKSQAIGDVVEIIKDVTNQTNLLALNASIEASKAGEAGKGFSIVAGEIKKLAENVAESAKEIKEIVSEIQGAVNNAVMAMEEEEKKITQGSQLAEEAKRMLEDINRATRESASAAEQIGESISQQNVATQEVSGAILHISQGFSKTAEENIRIDESLRHLNEISETLSRIIDQIKVEESIQES
ncbi:MAG: methyl-accepting chemotaxis protein [Thermodesulfobacteriota bacterium]|nr:methyl-accepting chemotaxis protein [Thermodesulfobacteriota bacterium]